jgi:hypothetical protein
MYRHFAEPFLPGRQIAFLGVCQTDIQFLLEKNMDDNVLKKFWVCETVCGL